MKKSRCVMSNKFATGVEDSFVGTINGCMCIFIGRTQIDTSTSTSTPPCNMEVDNKSALAGGELKQWLFPRLPRLHRWWETRSLGN